jgi:branched-chain amino acid transport system ATP-binding protein
MLTVSDLVATYGAVRALDGVSFRVSEGSITAVLGANGAGKTTLLRTINGLVRARSGDVRLGDRRLNDTRVEDMVRLGLAHVPEGRGVVAELGVEENLVLGGLWHKNAAERAGLLHEMYAMFPALAGRRRNLATTLSGGERQMLAIARALMSRPRLLLLDEPSLGLAPRITAQIMSVLRELRDETGLTVLLVEQNARSALSIADHGVVLNLGTVVADAPAEQLLGDEQLRRHYLGF